MRIADTAVPETEWWWRRRRWQLQPNKLCTHRHLRETTKTTERNEEEEKKVSIKSLLVDKN